MMYHFYFIFFTGSNVSVLCKIIPKIILHSTGLLFNNNNTVSDSLSHEVLPRITGLTGNGGEKLELFEVMDTQLLYTCTCTFRFLIIKAGLFVIIIFLFLEY